MNFATANPTALIAEDEAPLARDLAVRLSAAWPELQIVATASNGLDALERIEELRPDIVFLDINMPGLTGLQVAQQLDPKPHIVFVTAYSEHAVEAFEREAVDYLLKPVQDERLQQTVARLKSRVKKQEPAQDLESLLSGLLGKLPGQERFLKWIRAGVGNTIHNIAIEDVLYFEAEDKYTRVVTRTVESLVRIAISELEVQLDPALFQRVHRGTIVNLRAIKAIHKNELGALELVIDGRKETLAVSRAHAGAFRQM
jgi:DNA-binding LytR/AlgR family response regulator